ncbi:MAG: 16S rRNA (guanine(527)-N(7))-methyltransferase RsmG [Panacagrimonas sp.]
MKKAAEVDTGPAALLATGLGALGLSSTLAPALLAYLAELVKWNAAYNLTAVRNPSDMVVRHLLDSLAVHACASGRLREDARILDVGSGAGLPGIPLAIACPRWQVTVLDSNGKKARFLRHAVRALQLANVTVVEARVEHHRADPPFDAIFSRALSALGEFTRTSDHLLASNGLWFAMKGRVEAAELAALAPEAQPLAVEPLRVPGLAEERHLIVIGRTGEHG